MATCRSCGEYIIFKTTDNGKWMPLDPEPTMDGNVLAEGAKSCRVPGREELAELQAEGRLLYTHHKVTCLASTEEKRDAAVHESKKEKMKRANDLAWGGTRG